MVSWLAALLLAGTAQAGTVVLEIDDVRSTEGRLLVAVFRGSDGFPSDSERAHLRTIATPAAPRTTVVLGDLPAGEYAVCVVHDENGNGALDVGRVIPMPTEPLGSSRDAKARFGPPKYADAAFVVPAEGRHVERFRMVHF